MNGLPARSEGALTYLLQILPHLAAAAADIEFVILTNSAGAPPIQHRVSNCSNVRIITLPGLHHPIRRLLWEQTRLAPFLTGREIDVLFAPTPPVPLRSVIPTVVAVRNMEPYCPHLWATATRRERMRYRYLRRATGWSLRRASRVIFASEDSRTTVCRFHGRPRDHTAVIPHGCGAEFRPIAKDVARKAMHQTFGLDMPYVIYPSKTRAYKHHREVVAAVALLRDRWDLVPHLVVVGAVETPYGAQVREDVRRLGLTDRVHFLGDVAYDLMPLLYSAGTICVYASSCEACPNIVLEALGSGATIAASDIAPIREICGDAAAYFNPHDPQTIAATLARLLVASDLRGELSHRAEARAKAYSWSETARRTLGVIREAFQDVRPVAC